MMDLYFPNSRWMRVRKDLYDRLVIYKRQNAFPTLETALEYFLDDALKDVQHTEKHTA